MSLKDWQDNGWLKPHKTDKGEISSLLAVVERDLKDAKISGLSPDWQFGIAYNAALKLCTIVLYTQGYRTENTLAHYRSIMALKEISTNQWREYAVYLNACRMRRNTLELEYDRVDAVSANDAMQLIAFATSFLSEVRGYLAEHFPQYVSFSDEGPA